MAKNKQKFISQKGAKAQKYKEIFQGKRESDNNIPNKNTTKYRGEK